MCFGDYQKLIGNGGRIGNLLEHLHHQNINFLVLGRDMSNLFEMLIRRKFQLLSARRPCVRGTRYFLWCPPLAVSSIATDAKTATPAWPENLVLTVCPAGE